MVAALTMFEVNMSAIIAFDRPEGNCRLFHGRFQDQRLERLATILFARMIIMMCISLRRLAGCRKTEVAFGRLLKNKKFTAEKIVEAYIGKTTQIAEKSKHVLLIQDSVFLCFGRRGHTAKTGLGVGGNEYAMGFYLHPVLAVDPEQEICLGLASLHYWVRNEDTEKRRSKSLERHSLAIQDKESFRWISCANKAKKIFKTGVKKTVIADRESDIYEEFYLVPDEDTFLITRSSHDRNLMCGQKLFALLDETKSLGSYKVNLPALTGKRTSRVAKLEIRMTEVELKNPGRTNKDAPKSIKVQAIDVREKGVLKDKIHWRLLTTHQVKTLEDCLQIIEWYKQRWHVEQLFRTLKRQGYDAESSQINSYDSLHKLCVLALICSVNSMKLTIARQSSSKRPITDVFEDEDLDLLEKINKKVQGATVKQKNPYKKGRLSWSSWVIARLGGWTGYACEHPPGPITMRRGLEIFETLKLGWSMGL